jgi:hypothetical protein
MKLEVAEPNVVEYDADGVLVRVEYSGDEVQKFLRSFDDPRERALRLCAPGRPRKAAPRLGRLSPPCRRWRCS